MITPQTLKNAARAIEHDLWTDTSGANYLVKDGAILRRWEPVDDDGDALRLAMALNIDICYWIASDSVACSALFAAQEHHAVEAMDSFGVRNAIVMVAAKIGCSL